MIRPLLRIVLVATLGAGVVGLLRQRREAQAVRRGERPHPSAFSEDELPAAYGALARRLALWVPSRPRSTTGRWIAGVWASPLTAVGWLVAGLSGRRPDWDDERGCFVAREVGGTSRFVLHGIGAQANAIGQVVLCTGPRPSSTLLTHESVHVRQAERFGPLLFPLYVWLGARYGYRNHPLERAARLAASRGPRPDS